MNERRRKEEIRRRRRRRKEEIIREEKEGIKSNTPTHHVFLLNNKGKEGRRRDLWFRIKYSYIHY